MVFFDSSYGVNNTITLQEDLNDYSGVLDTYINVADYETPPQYSVNYGQAIELYLERNGDSNPLIKFDLSQIPSTSTVISAILSLYNTTDNATGEFKRRINLYKVLRDWDEGNQINSAIDAAGKHGATGNNAFDYYFEEGTDVLWNTQGMAADFDYFSTPESYVDVVNEGWYQWDISTLARSWIRGETNNYGLVLRDSTGYEDDNLDWRVFISSQSTDDISLRPKLTIVYNPDVPYANAGTDYENLSWNGGPINLDGSSSHNSPGNSDTTLSYLWTVVKAAYGSALSGTTIGSDKIASFTPDVPGEWQIQLTVTNSKEETATDTVDLRLLTISSEHPRIYITTQKLASLKKRAVPSNSKWTQLKAEADDSNGEMHAKALVGLITGTASYCDDAIDNALTLIADSNDYSTKAGDVALVYDYCHDCLTSTEQTTFINYFNTWGDDTPKDEDSSGWGNYWPRYGYSYALMGLATYGDNPRAKEWIDEYRHRRYRDTDLLMLDYISKGGAWPEGMVYDWVANHPRVKALEAWATSTGENLFESTPWFENRLGYLLLHHWPGVSDQWGYYYHPYIGTGDSERNRGSMFNYGRIMTLILIERFSDTSLAAQLQAYLSASLVNNSMDFLSHEEFLWYDPDLDSTVPSLLTHYAEGTGTLFMRSGWPDGAADTDTSATYITFQSGDHFCYHQHFDQNSFTLFKYDPLAVDSGVYSQEGTSNHDINYYVRTIAHNTLVVYNPSEDFSHSRPDASSNDGGQRSVYPSTRSPETVEYFQQHATHYDTGDMLRFENGVRYTYALGDATKAYNNPTYNQAMDAGLSGNIPKVNRFQREFIYLRPETTGGSDYIVMYDRVGVVSSDFSGENTKLLFHTLGEPMVNGTAQSISLGETLYSGADLAIATSGNGKLFIKTILPKNCYIRKVGGRENKAFWVFDGNYDWHWDTSENQPRPNNNFEDTPYGEWRLELEPPDTALDHNFLTLLYPSSSSTTTMPETTTIEGNGMSGLEIVDQTLNRVVLFSSDTTGESPTGVITYTCEQGKLSDHILVDLVPSTQYKMETTRDNGVRNITLTPDTKGTYQVSSEGVLTYMLGPDDLLEIKGLSISGTPTTNSQITFKVDAASGNDTLYYRFSVHPDYGTSKFDGSNWSSMTSSDYTLQNTINYTFDTAGKYIVVVWVTTIQDNSVSEGIPIIGLSMDIGDDSCKSNITGLTISGDQKINTPVTFTVNSTNECNTDYYRFSIHPDYGTAGYDGQQWETITSTEWVSSNAVNHTFNESGKYIVVVWVTDDIETVNPNGIPTIGVSVDIE